MMTKIDMSEYQFLDNDVCMIMKQNENDEVSKCQK